MKVTITKGVLLFLAIGVVYLALSTAIRLKQDCPPCEVPVIVEVLNGCGVGGIAENVAEGLRSQGFDIMFVGNADDFDYEDTLVVDRSGDRDKARAVAMALGESEMIRQVRSAFFVDVTVIVGSDMAPPGEEDV